MNICPAEFLSVWILLLQSYCVIYMLSYSGFTLCLFIISQRHRSQVTTAHYGEAPADINIHLSDAIYCAFLMLLEKEMATLSSILAWRILRTEETGGLQSTGLQESDTT